MKNETATNQGRRRLIVSREDGAGCVSGDMERDPKKGLPFGEAFVTGFAGKQRFVGVLKPQVGT
ncbi:MAG TPA: hypothetical protein VL357_00790 [Rariglobus sp.]|nr:hypothetical protein [Rariglobus sp.]